ncbi:MAG: glycosyl hydrolase family 8 [Nannocystaceae bacterium]
MKVMSPDAPAVPEDVAPVAAPFGSHKLRYTEGTILPAGEQTVLDQAVRDFYDKTWREWFLETGCAPGLYYVRSATMENNLTVSEAHGYGMMILALMAGHEPRAKAYFDGMYRYFRTFPSRFSPDLMAWYQNTSCENDEGDDSASDGDIDIAYAMLLADKQWGSCGEINYKEEALKIIAAIRDQELDGHKQYVVLGDWVKPGDAKFYPATRPSDFVVDHFHTFGAVSNDPAWSQLNDSLLEITTAVQREHSPTAGLVPDFVLNPKTSPTPADVGFLEGEHDGMYAYNACRTPWRWGTHFLVSGDERWRDVLRKMNAFAKTISKSDPNNLRSGYDLDGKATQAENNMSFIAPFGVSAMIDAENQDWLDSIWKLMLERRTEGYYKDSIKLLSMIVMTGNWLAPEALPDVSCQ